MTGEQTITPHEARVVCHHFGLPGGYAASGFVALLVTAMVAADWASLGRLSLGFPGLTAAVRLAKGDEVAVARLQRIAQQAPDSAESAAGDQL